MRASDVSDQRAYNQKLIEEFRASREQPDGPMPGRPLLLLTTTGAKTGQRRTTPMMFVRDGEQVVVIASNAGAEHHPDWYHNLVAHSTVTVEVGKDTYEATARVASGEDRERLWKQIVAGYPFFADHQAKTTRQIPVVVLERPHQA